MKKLVEAVHLLLHLKETKANKLEVMTLKVTTEQNILPRDNLFCPFFFFSFSFVISLEERDSLTLI